MGWGLRLDGCDPDGWNYVAMPEQWGGCGDGERRFTLRVLGGVFIILFPRATKRGRIDTESSI